MRKIQILLAATTTALALAATSAHADTLWDFSFSDIATSGATLTASGTFTTTGNGSSPSDVTSISGMYSDGTTIDGALNLVPVSVAGGVQNTSQDGFYYYDNVYGGTDGLDINGLLFTAGTQEVNLYKQDGVFNVVTTYGGFGAWAITPVNLTVAAVPEPGSIEMLLAGMAALGFVSRRKARG